MKVGGKAVIFQSRRGDVRHVGARRDVPHRAVAVRGEPWGLYWWRCFHQFRTMLKVMEINVVEIAATACSYP